MAKLLLNGKEIELSSEELKKFTELRPGKLDMSKRVVIRLKDGRGLLMWPRSIDPETIDRVEVEFLTEFLPSLRISG